METLKTIPSALAALIPSWQLEYIQKNMDGFLDEIEYLETRLKNCPKIGKTEGKKEHPVIFHYRFRETHIYVCEFDGDDLFFGYAILNGDLHNSEWGYSSLSEIKNIPHFKIDFYFKEQSIEAALYTAYPNYFKKPPSL